MVQIASTEIEADPKGAALYPPGSAEAIFLDYVRRYGRYSLLWTQKAYVNRSIFLNLAFVRGFQDLYVSRDHPDLQEIPIPKSRQYLTRNHVQRVVDAIVGLMQEFRPVVQAYPMEDTLDAKYAAIAVTNVLRAYHHLLRLDDKWDETIEWAATTGNSFLTTSWNAMSGEDILTVQPTPDGQIAVRQMKSGDIDAQVVGPLELYVPFAATDLEPLRCPWWARLHMISREGARGMFGEVAASLPSAKGFPLYGQESWERKILQMGAGVSGKSLGFYTSDYQNTGLDSDYIPLTQLHMLPQGPNARGLHGIESGGYVLDVGPCDHDDIVKFGFRYQPGQFWWKGVVDDLMHPQRAINDTVRRRLEWRQKAYTARVLAQKGVRFKEHRMENGQGSVLEWEGDVANATKPEAFAFPNPDPEFHHELAEMMADFDRIAKVHASWAGGPAEKNIRSGDQLEIMQIGTQRTHSPILKGLKRSWVKVYENILSLLRRHAVDERTLPVGSGEEFVRFRAHDLMRKVRLEVDLVPNSMTSQTIAKGHIDHLVQFGFLLPQTPADRAIVLKGYNLPGSELAVRTMTADVELQEREILKMIGDPIHQTQGQEVPINDNDVHPDHIRVTDLFRKSPEWERLDPESQSRILRHDAAHRMAQAEQLKLAMEMAVDSGPQGAVETPAPAAKG
jgi:hypothetical protein